MRSPVLSLAAGLSLAASAHAQPYVGPLPGGRLIIPPAHGDKCASIHIEPLKGPRSGTQSFCVPSQLQCNNFVALQTRIEASLCAEDRAICAKGTSMCGRKGECRPRVSEPAHMLMTLTWRPDRKCAPQLQCQVIWRFEKDAALECGCACGS